MSVVSEKPVYGVDTVFIRDNFLSADECDILTSWTIANLQSGYFSKIHSGRLTTRFTKQKVPYPDMAYEAQARLIHIMGLEGVAKAPFSDGIVSGYAPSVNEYYYGPHMDPTYIPNTYTLHCNVVTTDSLGGEVQIEGHGTVEMRKGRLVAYPVSELSHEVNDAKAHGHRNVWVFGFCVERPWIFV